MISAQEAKALVENHIAEEAQKTRKAIDSAMNVLSEKITQAASKGRQVIGVVYTGNPKSTNTTAKNSDVWIGDCLMTDACSAAYTERCPKNTEEAEQLKQELESLGYTVKLELSKIEISW